MQDPPRDGRPEERREAGVRSRPRAPGRLGFMKPCGGLASASRREKEDIIRIRTLYAVCVVLVLWVIELFHKNPYLPLI